MMAKERKKEATCGNAGGTSPSACPEEKMLYNNTTGSIGFKMAPVRPSEEELGRKWDRCLVDMTFKTVGGAVFGGVFSLLFFKRAAWPITLGLGIGIGAGYSNCRHQFLWHGPHRPPFHFGRPPWAGGGRPFWQRTGKDGKEHPPCHQEWKHSKQEGSTAVQQAKGQAESKPEDKSSES